MLCKLCLFQGNFYEEYNRHQFSTLGEKSHKNRLHMFWTFEGKIIMDLDEICKGFGLKPYLYFK